ncbi:MAG: ABC transporter ATP-binding protein [Actinomycetales bacterium]
MPNVPNSPTSHATAPTRGGLRIQLDHLTKHYPGQPRPAVEDVTMDIPAGELVVFVGPSGCGKTTTMRMINRLIEPTSGTIRLGDEDVTHVDPDDLRRRIGYVIQQIGLFPHLTIAENVATVPKLLGWPKQRVAARVEELLELVSLDPAVFAKRYPKQLSGGQQQRVGVARALAADPGVLLMDEPFGATDPITRVRLQREFRRLQQELGKTVVFVTHDFEEALLLGDRVAVLSERSHIEQYDTPLAILSAPANDHVRSFVGDSAHVRMLGLMTVDALPLRPGAGVASVAADASLREVVDRFVAGAATVGVRTADGSTVVGHVTFQDISDVLGARVQAQHEAAAAEVAAGGAEGVGSAWRPKTVPAPARAGEL